jgi:hypothetical protein
MRFARSRVDTESLAEHLGDLAHGHDVPLMTADRAREPGGILHRANQRRAVRSANAFMIPAKASAGDPNMTG